MLEDGLFLSALTSTDVLSGVTDYPRPFRSSVKYDYGSLRFRRIGWIKECPFFFFLLYETKKKDTPPSQEAHPAFPAQANIFVHLEAQ